MSGSHESLWPHVFWTFLSLSMSPGNLETGVGVCTQERKGVGAGVSELLLRSRPGVKQLWSLTVQNPPHPTTLEESGYSELLPSPS